MTEFSEWLQAKYISWRGSAIGRDGSISAFAEHIGVSQPVMSNWLAGAQSPGSAKNVLALIRAYPREALRFMNLDIEIINEIKKEFGADFQPLAEAWLRLKPEQQSKLLQQVWDLGDSNDNGNGQ